MQHMPSTKLSRLAQELGIETCLEFDAGLLAPEQRIRDLCFENRCGNYGNNYMCPPHIGSVEEIKARLKEFRQGVLLQYSKTLDVTGDIKGLRQTKVDFHNKVLRLEECLRSRGLKQVWGMIGGNCALCETCKAETGDPCPHPDKARTSLESLAINVVGLLEKFNLDCNFRRDRITWTGCILFKEE
jgi:predicted metal-binding protein